MTSPFGGQWLAFPAEEIVSVQWCRSVEVDSVLPASPEAPSRAAQIVLGAGARS
jgi:hypothetical protein